MHYDGVSAPGRLLIILALFSHHRPHRTVASRWTTQKKTGCIARYNSFALNLYMVGTALMELLRWAGLLRLCAFEKPSPSHHRLAKSNVSSLSVYISPPHSANMQRKLSCIICFQPCDRADFRLVVPRNPTVMWNWQRMAE